MSEYQLVGKDAGRITNTKFFKTLQKNFGPLQVMWHPDESFALSVCRGAEVVGRLCTKEYYTNPDYPVSYEGSVSIDGEKRSLIRRGYKREDFNKFPFDIERTELLAVTRCVKSQYDAEQRQHIERAEDDAVRARYLLTGLNASDIKRLEELLKPGIFGGQSRDGFLGKDESLVGVLNKDAELLQGMGVTHQQIGDKLALLTSSALDLYDEEYRKTGADAYYKKRRSGVVIEGYNVSAIGWAGYQCCPWCEVALKGYKGGRLKQHATKYDFTITNLKTGKKINFSGLLPHLIRDHQFFEGSTSYRLDPGETIACIELAVIS